MSVLFTPPQLKFAASQDTLAVESVTVCIITHPVKRFFEYMKYHFVDITRNEGSHSIETSYGVQESCCYFTL